MNNRPVIKLSPTSNDKLFDLAGLLAMAALWALSIFWYLQLPETIPTHFNSQGEADDHGPRAMLFLLPVIGTLLFAGMTMLVKRPHLFNYAVTIDERNAEKQYRLAATTMRVLKLGILLGCMISVVETAAAAAKQEDRISAWSWLVQLALILLPVGWYLYRSFRSR